MKTLACLVGGASLAILSSPALAQTPAPASGVVVKPLLDARLRHENVNRAAPLTDADATTLRVRLGLEARQGAWSVLAEGEGSLALGDDYNDNIPGNGVEPFATISDPSTLELNRLQLQYKTAPLTVTVGRQRILLDDQRFVANSGWRQNEQTYDAVRAEGVLGPVKLDLVYANTVNTGLGAQAEARERYDGEFVFLGAGVAAGPVTLKGFGYLLDYEEAIQFANSSDTFGLRATGAVPGPVGAPIALAASYARQSDAGSNPIDYSADYWAFDATTPLAGLGLNLGYERLGSDNGKGFQTPLASLHKFNGWADQFLTTPALGLVDIYVGLSKTFPAAQGRPPITAAVVWHDFTSAQGDRRYGQEWDAQLGSRLGKLGIVAKYADYRADGFAVDVRKIWLQLEWIL